MGGSSGGGSQTVTNRTEVDPVTQAWRTRIINAGGQLYDQGAPAYYPGSQVVPFSNQTNAGLNQLQSVAQGGVPNMGAANAANARALSRDNPAEFGAHYTAQGGLNNQMAGGLSQYGQGVNPGLQSLFQQGAQQIGDAVNGNFMRAGRFGPNAAHSGAMTRELGNLWSQINVPAWEAERNRGLTANQSLAQVGEANANRQFGAVGLIGDLHAQNNQDAARAQALMPSMYQLSMMPGQSMLDIGSMYEGQAGQYLQDDVNRYNYNANAPWDYLQRYSNVVNGMPDFSGSSTTSPVQGGNRALGAMGGATAGMGLASGMGLLGGAAGTVGAMNAWNPLGWALLGGGALAGGLF